MPIESIEKFTPLTQPESSLVNSLAFKEKAGLLLGVFAAALTMGASQPQIANALPRPAPSGETCAQKVNFYTRQGALFGKIKPSDCKARPTILNNLLAIEKAGRYFDYNPIGGVAVAACESGLKADAVGRVDSRDNGLFQQHNPYWYGRLNQTRSYIKARLLPGRKAIKLPDSIFSARSNAYVSVHMLRRGGGTTHWAPSRRCWSSKYQEVSGTKTRVSDWFALGRRG